MHIHLIAVGGTGMAPLACLLQGRGHLVTGSDQPLYPPMSTLLAQAGIEPMVGYDPAHLEPRPDLVVVGNAVPRSNPEARAAEERGIERISMPEALWRFFLADHRRLVAAGTHGKTTTTSMAAWVWTACGRDPSFLIGGVPKNLPTSFHRGAGRHFLLEGDEYNAAYFDRGPKFLHYRPDVLILTSAEYDHADLYPSHESLLEAFARLVEGLPADGLLVAAADETQVRALAARAPCRVILYSADPGLPGRLGVEDLPLDRDRGDRLVVPEGAPVEGPDGTRCRISWPGEGAAEGEAEGTFELRLRVPGRHNLSNALAVWIAAREEGLDAGEAAAALESFAGVTRRLDELGTAAGVTVVDDFAHHPTAVAASLGGLAARYPERRRVALFEPRSLTAGRSLFQEEYPEAFREAQVVHFAPIHYAERLEDDERLDLEAVAEALRRRGIEVFLHADHDALLATALEEARPGDVIVTMSSGSFAGMPHRVYAALRGGAGQQG